MKDTSKKMINVKIDGKLVKDTKRILDKLGINQTIAITTFYKMIVANNGIPYGVMLPDKKDKVPNYRTSFGEPTVEELKYQEEIEAWQADSYDDD